MKYTGTMKRFLIQLLQTLRGHTPKPPLNTPEELEVFKRDAIDNKGKHY